MTYALTNLPRSKPPAGMMTTAAIEQCATCREPISTSGGGSGTVIICDGCAEKIKTGEYRLTRGDA